MAFTVPYSTSSPFASLREFLLAFLSKPSVFYVVRPP
jgi:hypothetical protein